MNTSLLTQELEPLNAQIEQTRAKLEVLGGELRVVEAELETFSADRQRFDALRDACNALDKLTELKAGELFWEGVPEVTDAAGHINRLRGRVARFEGEIRGVLEKQAALKAQVNDGLNELDYLFDEVNDAHARDERRKEEFIIEREISPVPPRALVMPWTTDGECEKRFRRAMLTALFFSMVLGYLIPLVNVPVPDRMALVVEIPERLAMLVKKEPPRPEPVAERPREEKKPQTDQGQTEKKTQPEQQKPQERPAAKGEPKPGTPGEVQLARKKAENTGLLAFKSDFADLMEEIPVARLGAEARLSKDASQAAGQAQAQRSLVAMQAQGSSGGIGNAGVSRNLGYGGSGGGNGVGRGGSGGGGGGGNADRIGGVGFARVESAVAGLAEESRPLSSGAGPARTDEEIQIVFDRYKAALYRIYNTELRKNPTLRGKILMRITIEPGGEVSACSVESTDLASPELVAQIVERVKRFNFGPKEDVPKTTILYPIDFLPAV
ncbi:MAG TPA: AgmX/PglI C-terminal domain-containing protein [Desulfuromonadales bacterium]|nr:AgmX/PglI C-terminal domain-containing protein [Desulfuromonadales bacterium]